MNENITSNLEALPHNLMPAPVHSVPLSKDYLLYSYNKEVCPYSSAFQTNQTLTKNYTNFEILMQPTLTNLELLTH
jgi:hypothetical protein